MVIILFPPLWNCEKFDDSKEQFQRHWLVTYICFRTYNN